MTRREGYDVPFTVSLLGSCQYDRSSFKVLQKRFLIFRVLSLLHVYYFYN